MTRHLLTPARPNLSSESSRCGRTLRSKLVGLFLLLMPLPVGAATRVTLPDAAAYSYWVQSPTGTVAVMPISVSAHAHVTLPGKATSGTLYVLDGHTGEVAALPLTGQNLTLTVSDFKPLGAASSPAATPTPAVAATAAPPPPAPPVNGIARLFTLVFGLLIAGGVGWVIVHLYKSRGQPLIEAARRLGVDVPDPTAPLEEQAAPVYTPPAPRAVEKIPDEAGVTPPPPVPTPRRAAMGTMGTGDAPQIVGTQGVAAGSVFAVPIGEVTIGRNGDNGIVLAEGTVSRLHARLRRDAAGQITLVDNASTSGVYVNGRRITETTLAVGDQIQVGDNHFRLDA